MKRFKFIFLITLLLLECSNVIAQAPPNPFAMVGVPPQGGFAYMNLSSTGLLNTTGGAGTGLNMLQGYVNPVAPQALGTDGLFHYLLLDRMGNLKTSGGGGATGFTFTSNTTGFSIAAGTTSKTFTDRKSTRLNSSHLGISYAVF